MAARTWSRSRGLEGDTYGSSGSSTSGHTNLVAAPEIAPGHSNDGAAFMHLQSSQIVDKFTCCQPHSPATPEVWSGGKYAMPTTVRFRQGAGRLVEVDPITLVAQGLLIHLIPRQG